MRIAKEDIDIKMEIPGAVIRQRTDFGDATGLGKIGCEYFSLSKGVDTPRCSRDRKEICASALTGVSSYVGNSPRPARTARRRRSTRMICFTGRPGTT